MHAPIYSLFSFLSSFFFPFYARLRGNERRKKKEEEEEEEEREERRKKTKSKIGETLRNVNLAAISREFPNSELTI